MNRLNFIFGFAIIAFLVACKPAEKKITIGYVQITQDPVIDTARAGVFRALADSGFINGQNITVLENNAQGNISMISTILKTFQSQKVDIIITNGTPCMKAAAKAVRDIPVVFTVSFSPEQVGIKTASKNLYGIYDPLKAAEFVDLMTECIPDLKRIGIPYNNTEPNAKYSFNMLSEEFSKRGITVVTTSVKSSNDILQAGQYLAEEKIDAMVASADNIVYLGLPVLAKIASEQKIPLFVTDPLEAQKGAAIGFGVKYEQWGYQSGLKAVEILKGRTSLGKKIEPILNYDLIVNQKACAEQGLVVPKKSNRQSYPNY